MSTLLPGSVPPLFTLQQADGSRFELAQSLGRDRILIALRPSLGWMLDIARRVEDLADYQLQVLALTPLASLPPELESLAEVPPSSRWLHIGPEQAEVAEAYGAGERGSVAFLVGKDRGLKRVYAGRVSLDEVLALIDTMPMRQAEVHNRAT